MFNKVLTFFGGCRSEFEKLSWPTKDQVIRLTAIVFFICSIFALFFGVIDLGLSNLLQLIF